MLLVLGEIAVSLLVNLGLGGDSDARHVGVEVGRVEEAELAARLVHGDDAAHHQLAEIGELEAAIGGSLLRVE